MKKYFLSAVLFILSLNIFAQQQDDTYHYYINLKNVHNKMLTVELITPKITSQSATFRFPAMVPGTYSVYDFGRFIQNFKAYDVSGKELSITKPDVNSWVITDAASLNKISYDVEPTFESKLENPVFEPVGTNIEKDTNYVINNHGFFGYFDGLQNSTYNLKFTKPAGFYGATSLNAVQRTADEEQFTSQNYNILVDNPIMFSAADTASVLFDEANVMISVYSPGKGLTAKDISANLKTLLTAIRSYLGGKLPTDRYTFLFYFTGKPGVSGGMGALEHNQSSMYYLSDVPANYKDFMLKQLNSTCAHEFMHIVTPLTLHSEEIGNFDFNNPLMSKHLWLYEGSTEYSANYIQLREGLMPLKDYLEDINRKLRGASRYNDTLAFTEMSKGVLDKYQSQYTNVYEKGALIGLCLDILIRSESSGSQGLREVIAALSQKYGKDRSFKDDDLFGDITKLTSLKVGEFLDNYVGGSKRLPYKECFDMIGFTFTETPYEVIDFGTYKRGFNQATRRLKVTEIDENDEFQKALGIKKGDELVSVNGSTVSFFNMMSLFGSTKNIVKVGDDFTMEVARTGDDGKESTVKLSAKIMKTKTAYESKVTINQSATEEQLKLRNNWLGKN